MGMFFSVQNKADWDLLYFLVETICFKDSIFCKKQKFNLKLVPKKPVLKFIFSFSNQPTFLLYEYLDNNLVNKGTFLI